MAWNRASWRRLFARSPKRERRADSHRLEDVTDLFQRLGLDPDDYRAFSAPEPLARPALEPPESRRAEEFLAPLPRARLRGAPAEQPAPPGKPRLRATERPAAPQAATPERSRERPAYRVLSQLASNRAPRPDDGDVHAPVAGLISFTGGVGKSTLTAALGATLAEDGHRCALLGQTPHSPLLYYFGGPEDGGMPASHGVTRHTRMVGSSRRTIDLVIGDAPTEELLARLSARNVAPELALIDMEASPDAAQALEFVDLAVVPLRPDINALLTVDRIEQAWQSLECKPAAGLWYVMNQYDASRDLHRQVREAVSARVGERLLPLVLPLDNGVQQALASGEPPQVHDAQSPFSLTVGKLAAWLKAQLSADGSSGTPTG